MNFSLVSPEIFLSLKVDPQNLVFVGLSLDFLKEKFCLIVQCVIYWFHLKFPTRRDSATFRDKGKESRKKFLHCPGTK